MWSRPLFSAVIGFALLVLAVSPDIHISVLAAQSAPRPVLGTVPDVVASGHAIRIGHHASNDSIRLAIVLPLRNQTGLTAFLRSVTDPASPSYHHYLSQQQANSQFNPTAATEQTVISWLQKMGFTVSRTYANHLIVDASATVASIEHAFSVTLDDYQATVRGKPRTFYAPSGNPVLDGAVSGSISTIVGLDSYPRFRLPRLTHHTNGSTHGAPAYYPQDIANAYDMNPLWNGGYTGTGQHIGITLWTVPPSNPTLQAFGTHTGAAVATTANGKLKVIKVDGGTTSIDDGEAGMDIEYSGGMAPNATIDYYEAPTDSSGNPTDQGLIDALNQAGSDANNNLQITNSWGECEPSSTSDSFLSGTETVFATNSATGHDYLFSSGDNGSECGSTDPTPDYPTSSAHVTSVGGTKFSGNIGSNWPGEAAWAYASCSASCYAAGNEPEGSGGGYSKLFSRPSWQTGSGLAANGKRGYPDVSAVADPNTGAYVCYGASPSCGQIGGTSLASPLWAGMLAVTNQYLNAQGKQSAGFVSPTLYALAKGTAAFPAYHDILSGTNGVYLTGAKWDAVTGWGSIDAYNFARDIANVTASTGTATPTNTPGPPTNTPTNTPLPPTATNTPGAATATPTLTPLPPTSTPTFTPTPNSQLVANGGFETIRAPWNESSTGGYEIIDPTRPHIGKNSAWLCGYNYCNDQISQTITLPGSFSKVTLGYWLYVSTQESGGTCYDYFYSRFKSTTGTVLTNPQKICNANATNAWIYQTYDVTPALTAYKGRQVVVHFQGTTDSSLPTDYFVDDVVVVVG